MILFIKRKLDFPRRWVQTTATSQFRRCILQSPHFKTEYTRPVLLQWYNEMQPSLARTVYPLCISLTINHCGLLNVKKLLQNVLACLPGWLLTTGCGMEVICIFSPLDFLIQWFPVVYHVLTDYSQWELGGNTSQYGCKNWNVNVISALEKQTVHLLRVLYICTVFLFSTQFLSLLFCNIKELKTALCKTIQGAGGGVLFKVSETMKYNPASLVRGTNY